jgi:hypothetical protein
LIGQLKKEENFQKEIEKNINSNLKKIDQLSLFILIDEKK